MPSSIHIVGVEAYASIATDGTGEQRVRGVAIAVERSFIVVDDAEKAPVCILKDLLP